MAKLLDVVFCTKPITVNGLAREDRTFGASGKVGGDDTSPIYSDPSIYNTGTLYKRKLIYGYYSIKNDDPSINNNGSLTSGFTNLLNNVDFFDDIDTKYPDGYDGIEYVKVVEEVKTNEATKLTYDNQTNKAANGSTVGEFAPVPSTGTPSGGKETVLADEWVQASQPYFIKKSQLASVYELYDLSVHNFVGTVKLPKSEIKLLNGFRSEITGYVGKVPTYERNETQGMFWFGDEILDKLTMYLNQNLEIQFTQGRIKSDKFAEAYIMGMQAILQTAVSYASAKAQYDLQQAQTESAIEKSLASTEMTQRQTRAFDDTIAMKFLSEISTLSQTYIGADLDDETKVPSIAGGSFTGSPLNATFAKYAKSIGVPIPHLGISGGVQNPV